MASKPFTERASYDLFLSYNSADHGAVEDIARKLRNEGLEPFLDRWALAPGMRWRSELEKTLSSCKAVAVFVGPGEMGSWQQREIDVALDLQSRNPNLPVIPVLLRGCEPPLGFLGQLTWVDLRIQALETGIAILAKAARGEAPSPDLQKHLDAIRASICPYRGLLHFREEDAPFFFGREEAINKLSDAVQCRPFVAVVGASGSGKSSVVRAGLVPRLRGDHRTGWETVILVPTDHPLKALARALIPLLEPTMGEVDRLAQAARLAEHFRSGDVSFDDTVNRILERQPATGRMLIVIDQFEELYTLGSDEETRRRFLDELLAVSVRAGSKANVVLTLRGDFVGSALAYRPLSDRLQDAQINLGPMTRQELECAIRKPAEKVQLEFEPGLVRRILDAVGDEPGNLPLLEFVLKELWEQRHGGLLRNETYDAIGGLQGAVATKADELFKSLSLAEQKTLQRVFLRIVRPSEGALDTRRRAALSELPPEGVELVVKLANERLLVTNQFATGLQPTVEVAHEALISHWATLRAWVNEDREFLLWRERLGALLTEWERAQESDEALLRGPLLSEAQKWFDQRSQDLSGPERKFIAASRALRERLAREERERQEREIEAARKLAEEQKQRAELSERREKEQKEAARKLRRRAIVAVGAAAAAVILFATSVFMWHAAQDEAASERTAEERTREVASQANVSLARYSKQTGSDAQALGHLAQALRWNQRNYEAVALTGAMLTQNDWPLEIGGSIRFQRAIDHAQFSPDGRRLVTVSYDGTARLWDAATGNPIGQPMKHEGFVNSAQFSPDGQWVVTASGDKTARLWDAATGNAVGQIMKHNGLVNSAQFSPDGRRVVTASYDGTARLWDAATGNPIGQPMKHEGFVNSAQFSPDGQRVVSTSYDGTARLWDATTSNAIGEPMKHEGAVRSAQFSPDGRRVLTASEDNIARLWDAATGKTIGQPMKHEGLVSSAQFSPNGQWVLTASCDGTARLWDATTGNAIGEPMKHEGAVRSAQFSPDSQTVLTTAEDNIARLWDAATGKAIGQPMRHEGLVNSAQFSPDGQRVLTASGDKTARLWDAATGHVIGEAMRHDAVVRSAQFSPDGQRVLTASGDKTLWLWDTATHKAISEPMKHEGAVRSAQFSTDGQRVLTASEDNTARLWDAATGHAIGEPMRHDAAVRSAQFSPDGQRVLTASEDNTAQIWDAATGKAIGQPMKHQGVVNSAQFSPDGQRVLTASYDWTVRLWDAATGNPVGQPMKHEGLVDSAQFSADGQRVVSTSYDGTARLWDVATGNPIGQPMRHRGVVNSAQFSPDGQRVVTASGDKTARLWDAATGKAIGQPMRHDAVVHSAQFSPDGRRLVTASEDKTARLWDAATGNAIGEPMRHDAAVRSAQFSPDGQRVVSASEDKTVRLWDVATGNAIGEPMKHDGLVNSAQFSPDGQRVVTASYDGTARLWDVPTLSGEDSPEDVLLFADLAESSGGISVQTSGQAQIANLIPADQLQAVREKIAAKFQQPSSESTPLQRFLKWSVSERKNRTISPFSKLTVAEWVENRIREGTLGGLQDAIQVDPANARLAASFGWCLAYFALKKDGDLAEIRRARGEADFQTHRALKLASDDDEVRRLRTDVVNLLQPNSE
jgi:WD40 repeat protein